MYWYIWTATSHYWKSKQYTSSPSLETDSSICWINFSAHFAPIFVPRFLSNGDGRPPWQKDKTNHSILTASKLFHNINHSYKTSHGNLISSLYLIFHTAEQRQLSSICIIFCVSQVNFKICISNLHDLNNFQLHCHMTPVHTHVAMIMLLYAE